jgi:hypothetical protein
MSAATDGQSVIVPSAVGAPAAQHLDRLLTSLAGTPYEPEAQRWKADPAAAAGSKITCKTCHNPGRLSARLRSLEQ